MPSHTVIRTPSHSRCDDCPIRIPERTGRQPPMAPAKIGGVTGQHRHGPVLLQALHTTSGHRRRSTCSTSRRSTSSCVIITNAVWSPPAMPAKHTSRQDRLCRASRSRTSRSRAAAGVQRRASQPTSLGRRLLATLSRLTTGVSCGRLRWDQPAGGEPAGSIIRVASEFVMRTPLSAFGATTLTVLTAGMVRV